MNFTHKYNLRGLYFYPNKRKTKILTANSSDIPLVKWTVFVDHYKDSKTKINTYSIFLYYEYLEKKLGSSIYRNEVIVSTLLKKDGSYEEIAEYLSQDQERVATEGIHSKVLAHPNDNGKRVRGFNNAICPRGFGKSKHIFGVVNCGSSSSASQQYVADLERQLQEVKDQVTTLHRFLR
ncbi:hypothetical protein Ahy_A04g017153 [Arachis hypogaea]|uniref:Uncharacterized protein n=1 Tax=Arachis hypogaea TaxID=3818 RepID=A0A445DA57_ARAHY|nr:hypothetical protein Ahy_A04g017153 [Arachis hypogaea]